MGEQQKPRWGSRYGFLMAAIGSAVGLGNLWRFPFQAGENGGGAFILIYVVCVVLVAYPLLIAEFIIGRRGGTSAVGSARRLATQSGRSSRWSIVGWIGALAPILILPTYGLIAGQIMSFATMSALGQLTPAESGQFPLFSGPLATWFWFTGFILVTALIVMRGLNKGIEATSAILMPLFLLLLSGLAIYAMVVGPAGQTMTYLFEPRLSEVTPQVALSALGQALFSVGIGSALMITYAGFLDKGNPLPSNAGIIAGADTLVAILAGLMIFPLVLVQGADPAAGPSLIFDTLPTFFEDMAYGQLFGTLFFGLALIAALTSSISLLVVPRMVLIEEFGLPPRRATMCIALVGWVLGSVFILFDGLSARTDWIVGNVILPIGAFSASIAVGWVSAHSILFEELRSLTKPQLYVWYLLVRYLVPAAILLVLLFGLFG